MLIKNMFYAIREYLLEWLPRIGREEEEVEKVKDALKVIFDSIEGVQEFLELHRD